MSVFLRKYGTGTGADVIIPMIKRGVVDFAVTGDWTPASGDVKVSLDGAAPSNIGTLPVINGTYGWKFVFSDAELQCKVLRVTVVDSATKAVEDQMFLIETYGHASAMYKPDFSDSVRLGLTALPNATAGANGGLPLGDANGRVGVQAGTSAGQLDFTSGVVKANLAQILGTALTETAGQIAAAFKQFFDIPSPTSTMNRITLVDTTTTNTDMRGTDNAATAAALTTVEGKIDVIDGIVDSILADTGTDGVVLSSTTLNAIADALLDRTAGVETNRTPRQALRLILATAVGKLSGAATTTVVIRDTNDSKDRVSATVDADGNRTAVTLDAT